MRVSHRVLFLGLVSAPGKHFALILSLYKHNLVKKTVGSKFRWLGSIDGDSGIFRVSFFFSEPQFLHPWNVSANACLPFFAGLFWGSNKRRKIFAHHKTLSKHDSSLCGRYLLRKTLVSLSPHTHTKSQDLSVLRLFRVFLCAPPLLKWVEALEDGKEVTGDT